MKPHPFIRPRCSITFSKAQETIRILILALFALVCAPLAAADRPNLIWIMADDLFVDLAQRQNLYAKEPAKVRELTRF